MNRLADLRTQNASYADERMRVRSIMNGGAEGISAIMAWNLGKESSGGLKQGALGADLPAVNMMASGIERLAQKVGVAPTLKMPYGNRDSEPARKAAEKRERIIQGWDHMSGVDRHFPQLGRWLPGYSFVSWVIRPKIDPVTRQLWPHAELRDPYDTWPGYFGVEQQPHEIAYRRMVPMDVLARVYPEAADWETLKRGRSTISQLRVISAGGAPGAISTESSWAGPGGGTQVIEYYDSTGCYVCVPEFGLICDYSPNICETGPMFVVGKRYSFDRLVSHYHHVIGLVAMMAKLNVLSLIAAEMSTFRETNIIGELEGNTYERGYKATNFFTPGTVIDRPSAENNYQLWQQIDRVERQLRIGAAYDAGSDSLAARGGFITGRGQQELRDPIEANIAEYQMVIKAAMEDLDTRRLEWEQRHEKNRRKRVFYLEGDRQGEENYVPNNDIDGNWRSTRHYGMMATWDDSSKIVAGLQLLQGGVIDTLTMQENLDGLKNVPKINQRIAQDRARQGLLAMLEQRAAQADPAAAMALVEIFDRPDQMLKTLKRFFTPQEPQMTPEQAALAAGGGPGAPLPPAEMGPGPTVQTVLSELEASGTTGGGVQTVNVNRS